MSSFVNLLDIVYPVGSIYYSYTGDASPASTIGGTWSRIKDVFLWFTSDDATIGRTGGEKTHTLTVSEMPSHRHSAICKKPGNGQGVFGNYTDQWGASSLDATENRDTRYTQYTGGGGSHNNMPPYVQIAGWYRTA